MLFMFQKLILEKIVKNPTCPIVIWQLKKEKSIPAGMRLRQQKRIFYSIFISESFKKLLILFKSRSET